LNRLKANFIANLLGQGWRAAMSLAFIPIYIRELGAEAYGLIGIYASLQAWLFLVDMGLRPTLVREMARFTGGQHDAQSIRDLLRTSEIVAAVLCGGVALALWGASGWLAARWLNAEALPLDVVADALALMGLVAALQVMEGLYAGSIAGLEHQVKQNIIMSVMATLRGAGAALVVMFLAPDITAFFQWQLCVAVVATLTMGTALYRLLPKAGQAGRFSVAAIREVWRYASGMAVITVLVLLLTQVDKLLLAKLLPLEDFGHYMLASVVASALFYFYSPVVGAFFPRLATLAATPAAHEELRDNYHLGAQLVTLLAGSAGAVMSAFAEPLLRVWTGDEKLSQTVAPMLCLLAIGSLLNGLMALPYHLQLAHGWTRLTIIVNSVAACILVSALFVLVPRFGAIAAALVFVLLNAGYVTIAVWMMHGRLLPAEKWRWYLQDTALPLGCMMAFAWGASLLLPAGLSPASTLALVAAVGLATVAIGATLAPRVRRLLVTRLFHQRNVHPH
jgi:O-antigen/teichoic acid export membrane protein